MRARSKFGIAIAAMMRMMAITISNSISENRPFEGLMHSSAGSLPSSVLMARSFFVSSKGQEAVAYSLHGPELLLQNGRKGGTSA